MQGSTLEAPPAVTKPPKPAGSGGTSAGSGKKGTKTEASAPAAKPAPGAATAPGPSPAPALSIPSVPSSTCAAAGVPPILVPIYERAAAAYGLGPQGPAVLAGINEVETAFGTNLNVSSAGAVGWMQFMPSTWETYGVDANGDGVKDPYNPEDAIFAAARYLSAAGMPANTYDAILAYNHADWYVAEVLANASCYAPVFGGASTGLSAAPPKLQVLSCRPAPAGAAKSRPHISAPSRTPPPVTASAAAESGRWPRWPGSSRTSAAGWTGANSTAPARSASNPASGAGTRSTGTATGGSAIPTRPTPPPPWRG